MHFLLSIFYIRHFFIPVSHSIKKTCQRSVVNNRKWWRYTLGRYTRSILINYQLCLLRGIFGFYFGNLVQNGSHFESEMAAILKKIKIFKKWYLRLFGPLKVTLCPNLSSLWPFFIELIRFSWFFRNLQKWWFSVVRTIFFVIFGMFSPRLA